MNRPIVSCIYAELGDDFPLNRLVKAASSFVAASPFVGQVIRDRARKIRELMPDVGPLRPADLLAVPIALAVNTVRSCRLQSSFWMGAASQQR